MSDWEPCEAPAIARALAPDVEGRVNGVSPSTVDAIALRPGSTPSAGVAVIAEHERLVSVELGTGAVTEVASWPQRIHRVRWRGNDQLLLFDDDALVTLATYAPFAPVARLVVGAVASNGHALVTSRDNADGLTDFDVYAVVADGFEWATSFPGPAAWDLEIVGDVIYAQAGDQWARRAGLRAACDSARQRRERREAAVAAAPGPCLELVPWLPVSGQLLGPLDVRDRGQWEVFAAGFGGPAIAVDPSGGSTALGIVRGDDVATVDFDGHDVRWAFREDGARALITCSVEGVYELDLATGCIEHRVDRPEVFAAAYAPDGIFVAQDTTDRDDFDAPKRARVSWLVGGEQRWAAELEDVVAIASLRAGAVLLVGSGDGDVHFFRVEDRPVAAGVARGVGLDRAFTDERGVWIVSDSVLEDARAYRVHGLDQLVDGGEVSVVGHPADSR